MSVKVFFGSSTGETESVANQIAKAFGVDAVSVANASAADFDADLLILGSSTWGEGDLQDDWLDKIDELDSVDLSGKKVAVFGFGDQESFSGTYCNALGTLAEKAVSRGATLVGQTSTDGYAYDDSTAVKDGQFVGLALDNMNQSDKTDARVAAWIEVLKNA